MTSPTDKRCLTAAMRLLGRRDHSRHELWHKLKQRDFSDDSIAAAIAVCVEMKYLDDQRFGESYVGQLRRRGYGALRIVPQLRRKGLDEATIRSCMERCGRWENQLDDCRLALHKKLSSRLPQGGRERDRSRLFRFLHQRGFSSETISQVLGETLGLDP